MSADKYLRYRDLKDRGIVNNAVTLSRWIANEGFPHGFLLGPNTRVFSEAAVQVWLDSRPIENTRPQGALAHPKGGKR